MTITPPISSHVKSQAPAEPTGSHRTHPPEPASSVITDPAAITPDSRSSMLLFLCPSKMALLKIIFGRKAAVLRSHKKRLLN